MFWSLTYDQLLSFSDDCLSFYKSYIYADTFNFGDVIPEIVATATQTSVMTAELYNLDVAYFAGVTSLADNPTAYMKSLAASAAFWPETFSSALMSQATGLLLGYESIVSKDFLGVTPSPSITPGRSISASGAVATSTTAVVASNGQTSTAAVQPSASSAGSGQASASSAGAGAALASASPELIMSAAAAAAGVVGMILL